MKLQKFITGALAFFWACFLINLTHLGGREKLATRAPSTSQDSEAITLLKKKIENENSGSSLEVPMVKGNKKLSIALSQDPEVRPLIEPVGQFPCFNLSGSSDTDIDHWLNNPKSQLTKQVEKKVIIVKDTSGQIFRFLSERVAEGKVLHKKFKEDEDGYPIYIGLEKSEESLFETFEKQSLQIIQQEETLEIEGNHFQGQAIVVNDQVREIELVLSTGEKVGHCIGAHCSCRNI